MLEVLTVFGLGILFGVVLIGFVATPNHSGAREHVIINILCILVMALILFALLDYLPA